MLMTGILMSGKISVGVRRTTTGVRIRISSAITTKVYGLRSANAAIHIEYCPQLPWGKPAAANSAARHYSIEVDRCETVRIGFIFDKVRWHARTRNPRQYCFTQAGPSPQRKGSQGRHSQHFGVARAGWIQ